MSSEACGPQKRVKVCRGPKRETNPQEVVARLRLGALGLLPLADWKGSKIKWELYVYVPHNRSRKPEKSLVHQIGSEEKKICEEKTILKVSRRDSLETRGRVDRQLGKFAAGQTNQTKIILGVQSSEVVSARFE